MVVILSDLILELEQAREGSRELDLRIAEHLGKSWADNRLELHQPLRDFEKTHGRLPDDDIALEWLPQFSTWIDDALPLIPETIISYRLNRHKNLRCQTTLWGINETGKKFERGAWANTLPLSLCSASLKAR